MIMITELDSAREKLKKRFLQVWMMYGQPINNKVNEK